MASLAECSREPVSQIDVSMLSDSRFLVRSARKYAYRDAAGRVNLHLLRLARLEIDKDPDVPDDVHEKLHKWLRHAERWAERTRQQRGASAPTLSALSEGEDAEAACGFSFVTSIGDMPWPVVAPPRLRHVVAGVTGSRSGRLHLSPTVTLATLPDDAFQQIVAACSDTAGDGLLHFEAVKGLGCLSKALLQQLHRLQPLVGVRSLAVVQRPAHGPWRVALLHSGALSEAVVEQARQGRVRSIDASKTSLPRTMGPRLALARRVVPELLGAGCSLLELDVSFVKLHVGGNWGCTWASIFGEAAVCSAVLRTLRLDSCGLKGPLPELRLPALQYLFLGKNHLSGGLDPLRECKALKILGLNDNMITGVLEPLRGCTAMHKLSCRSSLWQPASRWA